MTGRADAEEAPAKINLFLHVRGRRADGYHDLETLFAFTRFGDRLRAHPADDWSLAVEGPAAAALDPGADNLVLRAARAFALAASQVRPGQVQPCAFHLEKHVPVAAGLGGGSADAAATLRLLNRRQGHVFSLAELEAIAATLGADVPACVRARPAFGTGTGTLLRAMPSMAGLRVLLVNPGVAVATAEVFSRWDGRDRGPADPAEWRLMRNDLEAPALALHPAVAEVLAWLSRLPGAEVVRMSGSGATCLALFAGDVPEIAVPEGWWSVLTRLL